MRDQIPSKDSLLFLQLVHAKESLISLRKA